MKLSYKNLELHLCNWGFSTSLRMIRVLLFTWFLFRENSLNFHGKVEGRKAFTLIIRWQSRKEISKKINRK